MLWNNQPDREAFGLVRKGVGQSTVLRAVERPYPKVNPIQSNPPFTYLLHFHFLVIKGKERLKVDSSDFHNTSVSHQLVSTKEHKR